MLSDLHHRKEDSELRSRCHSKRTDTRFLQIGLSKWPGTRSPLSPRPISVLSYLLAVVRRWCRLADISRCSNSLFIHSACLRGNQLLSHDDLYHTGSLASRERCISLLHVRCDATGQSTGGEKDRPSFFEHPGTVSLGDRVQLAKRMEILP